MIKINIKTIILYLAVLIFASAASSSVTYVLVSEKYQGDSKRLSNA